MSEDPYPFESDDDIEIRELDLESVDAVAEARITVGDLAGEHESWRYGHVIVDEAQDLTPMQWRMVMRRVRGQSLTIVGDLAQRSASVVERWQDLLPKELADAQRQDLTVNYRSPSEIHALAVAVLADFAPSVAPSVALRASGWVPQFVRSASLSTELAGLIATELETVGGLVAVIALGGTNTAMARDEFEASESSRVRFLTPNEAKGLEFDAVILIEPASILAARGGAAQLYIALTRATQRLVVAHESPLPPVLEPPH